MLGRGNMMVWTNKPHKQQRVWLRRMSLGIVILPLIIAVTALLPTRAQGSEPTGICAATVEQLDGQGRFEMGGLGRFEMGGLEGDDATLDENDGVSPELLAEIMDNPITPEWLTNLLPRIEDGFGIGETPVALLIVDDFRNVTRTFSQANFPEEWLNQYFNAYESLPNFPLEVPVFTHGMRVESQLRDLLDAMDEAGYPYPISLHRVDISTGGDYDLASVSSGIAAKIGQLREQGIDRFVINMSFGLIPCSDPAVGESYENYLDQVTNLLFEGNTSHFVLDVDAFVTIQNEKVKRPVIRLDYGFKQHLYENVFGGELEAVHDYMRSLLLSSKVGEDSDEPEIEGLRDLLRNLLAESADSKGQLKVIPVAASGNFADIIQPDEPLAPARFPEVIAVGATLGQKEDADRWFFSQAGHILTPGAWWEFDAQNSFVAGTSFAAPYASVIGSIYLTYPDACYFDGSHPPLFDFDWSNRHVNEEDLQFACHPDGPPPPPDPTETPETPTETATTPSETPSETPTETVTATPTPEEMLNNQGFEDPVPGKPVQAKNWIGKNITADRRICNNEAKGIIHANGGQCAFRFAGSQRENSQLLQNYKGDLPVTGDALTLSAYLRGQNVKAGGYLRVVVKYVGDPVQQKSAISIPTGTYPYTLNTAEPIIIGEGTVKFVKTYVGYKGKGGKFWVDDVSVMREPAAAIQSIQLRFPVRPGQPVTLPTDPDGLRRP